MANIITGIRILCSIFLLFCHLFSPLFYAFYLTAGLTDIADGAVARHTNSADNFGANFDSFADLIFLIVCFVKLLPILDLPIWLYVWIVIIALIKVISFIYAVLHKNFFTVHTVMNKVTGFLLFLLPLTISFIPLKYSAIVVSLVATLAAIQDCFLYKVR